MRYRPDDRFWVVLDPAPNSEVGDVLFESSIRGLQLQFKGGLKMDRNPSIFADKGEAEEEVRRRLLAQKVAKVAQGMDDVSPEAVRRIQFLDADGKVVFDKDLR